MRFRLTTFMFVNETDLDGSVARRALTRSTAGGWTVRSSLRPSSEPAP